jgi:hypothetical protein
MRSNEAMMIQVRKTYRAVNPEMLYDVVRDLIAKQGLHVEHASIQTYSVSSGATQSRVTAPVRTPDGRALGSVHILGSSNNDARMALELDDAVVTPDAATAIQSDIDFILGSYEAKW